MRRRRAERCRLRAEVALEAGFPEEARSALEEARRLDANSPDFDTLQAVVTERQRSALEQKRHQRARRRTRFTAAAALVVAVAGATAALMPDGEPVPDAAATASALPAISDPPVPVYEEVRAAIVLPRERETPETANREPPAAQPATDRATPLENLDPAPPAREPAPDDAAPVVLPVVLPAVPPPVSASLPELPVVSAPLTTPAVEEPAAPKPQVDEAARVRAVLARYEAAYSSLNVAAARAVWPAVDGRSLARAFDGLESQRLSLGQCSLAINGTTARADCSGSASWTPKVGGGTRTEPRHWRFELQNASGDWQIVRAEAR